MGGLTNIKVILAGVLLGIVIATPFALRLFYGNGLAEITGKAASTVYIAFSNASYCNVSVITGWNLISFYCDADNMSTSNVLSTIQDNYLSIHTYDRHDPSDKWKAYKPDLPSWVIQDLSSISTKQGYWILMKSNDTILFNGSIKYPTIIFLFKGWNLVGYPANEPKLVNETFLDVIMNLDSVHLYTASNTSDHWKVYSTSVNVSQNDLLYMQPNFGYWVRMDDDDTWMVDE